MWWSGRGVAVRYRAWQRSSTCTAGALTIWHFFCHLCARKPHREARSPTRSTQTYTPREGRHVSSCVCAAVSKRGGAAHRKVSAYLAWKCAREGTAPEPLPPRNRSCVMCLSLRGTGHVSCALGGRVTRVTDRPPAFQKNTDPTCGGPKSARLPGRKKYDSPPRPSNARLLS